MSNSNAKNAHSKVLTMVQLGILAGIIVIMMFTPLGRLQIGPLYITFVMLPIAIGSIICGPLGGAVLGTLFGLISFSQCFGSDAFGTALMAINPIALFVMCVISRMLAGLLAGIIFKALCKIDKTRIISFAVSTLSAALLNTIFFIGALIIFFGKSEFITSMMNGATIWKFIVTLVGVNGLVEAVVCCVAGAAIAKALVVFIPSNKEKLDTKKVVTE